MALPTPKREPRQAREGATVARKGVAGPSCILGGKSRFCFVISSGYETRHPCWRTGNLSAKKGIKERFGPFGPQHLRKVSFAGLHQVSLSIVESATILRSAFSTRFRVGHDDNRSTHRHHKRFFSQNRDAPRLWRCAPRQHGDERARTGFEVGPRDRESIPYPWPKIFSLSASMRVRHAPLSSKTASSQNFTSNVVVATPAP